MKIWELQENVSEYEHITLVDASDDEWLALGDMFCGKKLINDWKPFNMKIILHDGSLKKSDIPYFSPGIPIFSEEAVNVLQCLFNNNVEILDVICDSGAYKIINVIKVIDGLDHEKSEILTFRCSNRIKAIKKYEFYLNSITGLHIFKIVEQSRGAVFVSDEFRNKVIESGLKGFKFIEVWDSND